MTSQQLSPSLVAWGILLGPPGLRLDSHVPRWGGLTGSRGSPGPQTPGSQPACDTGRQRLSAKLLWKLSGDFTDSDSDDFEETEGRYFRVRWEKPLGRGPWGGGGSRPQPGLSPSSSASSRAAPTSLSSSAACSAQCSRLLCRLLPSSTGDSSQILVSPAQRGHPKERPNTVRGELCLRGPRSHTLSLTESGYAEQLFQFLQATAQEEGLFGESQQPARALGGRGRVAGGCCPLVGSESPSSGVPAAGWRPLGPA